jgi:hypothetical protein
MTKAGKDAATKPVCKTPAELLEAAKQSLTDLQAQIEALREQRDQALLRDDDPQAARLESRIEGLNRQVRTATDKVRLLEEVAAKEAAERAAQEKQAKIAAVTALFAQRDERAAELQNHLIGAEKAFREIDALNTTLREAWPFSRNDHAPCLLAGGALALSVEHYIFKIGSRLEPPGGQIRPGGSLSFPGGRYPTLQDMYQPEKLPNLTAVFADATGLATAIMNGNRNSFLSAPLAAVAAATPVNLADGSVSTTNGAASNGGGASSPPIVPAVERTAQQVELSKLLVRQNELAALDTPEALAEYLANGLRVTQLS